MNEEPTAPPESQLSAIPDEQELNEMRQSLDKGWAVLAAMEDELGDLKQEVLEMARLVSGESPEDADWVKNTLGINVEQGIEGL